MFKIGDLVQIKEASLKRNNLSCEPNAVFRILEIGKYSYSINAKIIGSNIVECSDAEAKCHVGLTVLVPYIVPRASIDNVL